MAAEPAPSAVSSNVEVQTNMDMVMSYGFVDVVRVRRRRTGSSTLYGFFDVVRVRNGVAAEALLADLPTTFKGEAASSHGHNGRLPPVWHGLQADD